MRYGHRHVYGTYCGEGSGSGIIFGTETSVYQGPFKCDSEDYKGQAASGNNRGNGSESDRADFGLQFFTKMSSCDSAMPGNRAADDTVV